MFKFFIIYLLTLTVHANEKVVHLPGTGLSDAVKPEVFDDPDVSEERLKSNLSFLLINAGANHSQFSYSSQAESVNPDSYRYTIGFKSRLALGSTIGLSFDYSSDMTPKEHMTLSGAENGSIQNFQYAKVSKIDGHIGWRISSWHWEFEIRLGYHQSTIESGSNTPINFSPKGPSFSPIFYGSYDEGVFYFNPYYTFAEGFSLSKTTNHHFGAKAGLITNLWGPVKGDIYIAAEQYKVIDVTNEYFLSRIGLFLGFGI